MLTTVTTVTTEDLAALVAEAVNSSRIAQAARSAALDALRPAVDEAVYELGEAQAAYYSAGDHDDELWAVVETREAYLDHLEGLAAALDR